MDESRFEAFVDDLLGSKLVHSINEGAKMDFSEISFLDKEIKAENQHMTADMLAKEIERLESEAVQVEAKLQTMSLKERAEWDKHYPFSIVEHD